MRLPFQVFVHFTVGCKFEDEVYASFIIEIAIHSQNIGMPVETKNIVEINWWWKQKKFTASGIEFQFHVLIDAPYDISGAVIWKELSEQR